MVDIRGFNGGLNTDASPELLPNGDYTYAMNIENTAEGIINLPSSRPLGNSTQDPGGTDWVCGYHYDKKRQRIIYFLNNSTGKHRLMAHYLESDLTFTFFQDTVNIVGNSVATRSVKYFTQGASKIILISGLIDIYQNYVFTINGSSLGNNGQYIALNAVYDGVDTSITVLNFNSAGQETVNVDYPIYDTKSFTLEWPFIKQYDPNYLIKDIKVIHRDYDGDLIYFIDPNKKLRKFNFTRLVLPTTGTYGGNGIVRPEYFNVIKAPPSSVPSVRYEDDLNSKVNNLRKKLFQFRYRFVYDDNEKSVWGSISKVPIPSKLEDADYNIDNNVQNCIDIGINTGDINVSKVEIAGRVNIDDEWSDFFLIDTIDKQRDNVSSNVTYFYRFRNDSFYIPVDIQESSLLFDYVPDSVNTMELANGNTLVLGGLTDGYNRDTNISVSVSCDYNTSSSFNSTLSNIDADVFDDTGNDPFSAISINDSYSTVINNSNVFNNAGVIKFSGTPVVGDEITIRIDGYNEERWSDGWGTNYTLRWFDSSPGINEFKVIVKSGWTIANVIDAFIASGQSHPEFNVSGSRAKPTKPFYRPSPGSNWLYVGAIATTNLVDSRKYRYTGISVTIKKSLSFQQTAALRTVKWGGRYKYGIVYYDKNGKTNGVYSDNSMYVDTVEYDNNFVVDPSNLLLVRNPVVNLKIYNFAPSWASYFHVVRTKELTCDLSLIVMANNVTQSGDYMYFDIENVKNTNTNLKETGVIIKYDSQTFLPGDRVKFLADPRNQSQFENRDLEILSVEDVSGRRCLKVKSNSFIYPGNPHIIEIYRPSKVMSDKDLVYYEIGEKYNVVKFGDNYFHEGNIENQYNNSSPTPWAEISLYDDGDYYYRQRILDFSATTTPDYKTMFVADKNFSEYYKSAVSSEGRPLIVDENIRKEYYPAMLRFSQSYIFNTNINNTNRFYPLNFEEADASFGDILRLKTRENFIRMFQRNKIGMIPIYRQIIIDNAQSSQVALSEKLLNKPNYYSGEYGIDKYGSSLISTDYGDYFIDTLNKAIVRVSLDGLTNISDTNNLMTWSNNNIFEDSYGYGCFNYDNKNIIMLVGRIVNNNGTISAQNNIVAYNEPKKKFESFYSYTSAQGIMFINGYVYTLFCKTGAIGTTGVQLYKHNNESFRNFFYGQYASSKITSVFNANLQLKKTYTAIEELSDGVWTAVINTGPLTNQETNVALVDFEKNYGTGFFPLTLSNKLENKFNATIKRDTNGGGNKYYGEPMKGLYAQVALTNSYNTKQKLISVSLKYIQSPLTNS